MRNFILTLVALVLLSCGNNNQQKPVVRSTPSPVYTPPASNRNLSPFFEQKSNQFPNNRRNNTYNHSSDDRYYCENCGEVIYDTDESDEYCEDCLYEISEQEERIEEEEGDYDED